MVTLALMHLLLDYLSALVKRYSQVLQRYYIQFLSGQDTSVISQQIQVSWYVWYDTTDIINIVDTDVPYCIIVCLRCSRCPHVRKTSLFYWVRFAMLSRDFPLSKVIAYMRCSCYFMWRCQIVCYLLDVVHIITVVYVTVESGESFDFRGLRLDWFRLQVRIVIIRIIIFICTMENLRVTIFYLL